MPINPEKSVRLPPDHYALLRRLAEAEQRTLRATLERCLKVYARKHQPAALKEVA